MGDLCIYLEIRWHSGVTVTVRVGGLEWNLRQSSRPRSTCSLQVSCSHRILAGRLT